MLARLVHSWNALSTILVTLLGMTTLVTEVLPVPKMGVEPFPTFFTATPPNTLGMVTEPVAIEPVIVAPPFSAM